MCIYIYSFHLSDNASSNVLLTLHRTIIHLHTPLAYLHFTASILFDFLLSTQFSIKIIIFCNICHLKKSGDCLLPFAHASFSSTESQKFISDTIHPGLSLLRESIFKEL